VNAYFDLQRFHLSHEGHGPGSSFAVALDEIRRGRKTTHWMWYVFPQLSLGTSATSLKYAISGIDEAIAYLHDQILRDRLLMVTRATVEQLAEGVNPELLMGANGDWTKLRSSMTLFNVASTTCGDDEVREACQRVLALLAAAGITPCPKTLKLLSDERDS